MLRAGTLAVAVVIGAVQPGLALETALTSPDAPDDLLARLRAGSLALNAEARGLKTPQEILAAARSDYRTLVAILYDAGRYSPVVRIRVDGREAADIAPLESPSRVDRIEITVDAGPLFRFGRAEIAPLAPGTDLPEGFATGAPAPTGVLQATANASIGRWRDIGHAKARVGDQHIVANHRDAILDAQIRMDPGPELRFGQASISGNAAVRTDAIARIAGFPTGEAFSPDAAHKVARRLRRTGAFSSISLHEAETANPDGSLDYTISVAEALPRRIEAGAEYSSRQGVDLSLKWTHRNLFGGAERLHFDIRARNLGGTEPIDGQFSVRLDRPGMFGPDNDLFYLGNIEKLNEEHFDMFRSLAGIGVRRVFSDVLFGEIGVAAAFNRANDVFGAGRDFRLLLVPARLQWDRRDNSLDATKGFYLNASATAFSGFKNTESGLYGLLDGRGYLGFGARRGLVLAGRVQLGSVLGAGISQISPDLLFYSGGSGSVRGQPYQSLGVAIGTGIAGGRSFLNLSGEVRARVSDKISLVGFYDFGAVDTGRFVNQASPSHSGAGLGLRYDIAGIGALRLDIARPVSGTTGAGTQIYLGIGQAF